MLNTWQMKPNGHVVLSDPEAGLVDEHGITRRELGEYGCTAEAATAWARV